MSAVRGLVDVGLDDAMGGVLWVVIWIGVIVAWFLALVQVQAAAEQIEEL